MGDLTTNISRSEFSCECGCGFDTADIELVNALQDCVDYFGHCYILITGPNRCEKHNKAVGGAKNSQHLYGRAADFRIFDVKTRVQVDPGEVYDYLNETHKDKFGLGLYSNRVHFDTRSGGCARWGI